MQHKTAAAGFIITVLLHVIIMLLQYSHSLDWSETSKNAAETRPTITQNAARIPESRVDGKKKSRAARIDRDETPTRTEGETKKDDGRNRVLR